MIDMGSGGLYSALPCGGRISRGGADMAYVCRDGPCRFGFDDSMKGQ